jgi:hypothetical protein
MAIAGAARSRAIPLFASKCAQAVRGTAFSITIDALASVALSSASARPPRRGRIAIRRIEVDAAATQPTPEDGAGFVVVADRIALDPVDVRSRPNSVASALLDAA